MFKKKLKEFQLSYVQERNRGKGYCWRWVRVVKSTVENFGPVSTLEELLKNWKTPFNIL